MIKLIEVTRAGDDSDGSSDEKISVNADKIIRITDSPEDDIGNSIIYFIDTKLEYVNETREELTSIIGS